jgi:hypothetical protein
LSNVIYPDKTDNNSLLSVDKSFVSSGSEEIEYMEKENKFAKVR